MTEPQRPTRSDRIAALHQLAPLTRWEPSEEELYRAWFNASWTCTEPRYLHAAVWVRAYQLAWAAVASLGGGLNPLDTHLAPRQYAIERARRIWCVVIADEAADRWVTLDNKAEPEDYE